MSSSLDRSRGSAEDLLISHLKSKMAASSSEPPSGPNAAPKIRDSTTSQNLRASSSSPTESPDVNVEIEKNNRLGGCTTVNVRVATANIKYKNEAGRAAVLAVSNAVHHDFGALTSILNVTLPADVMDDLRNDLNIEWVDGSGAVYYVQPYRL